MGFQSILPRKISYEGCRLVGKKLEQHVKQYQSEASNLPLSADVLTEIEAVMVVTRILDSLSADPLNLRDVDRGADSFVAGYNDGLDALERTLNHGHIVPLTNDEKARLEAVQRVRYALFPSGTDFIRKSNHIQWSALQDIKNQIVDKETGAAIPQMNQDLKDLGLATQTERLLRWIDKYGEAIGADGIVEERIKKVNETTEQFLSAWEDFAIESRSATKKTKEPKLKEAYVTFTGLYDEQAQRELEIEQRYKRAAEKKAEEKQKAQTAPVEDQKTPEKS